MAYCELDDSVRLYYEDQGQGRPVLFLHSVWSSSRFFRKQLPYFAERHRAMAVDFRGHGQSSVVHHGHTTDGYARDVRAFLRKLDLTGVVLVGWSMGAFVIWDYLRQFGPADVKATVIVDQPASDFKWPDWPFGAWDFKQLCEMMHGVQTNRTEIVRQFISQMFKVTPPPEEMEWMLAEYLRMPASIAGSILFDQTVTDYRPHLAGFTVPTLLCFGRDAKLVPIAAGEHLERSLPCARLVPFEYSGHSPFLEEPERFNHVVDEFVRSLDAA